MDVQGPLSAPYVDAIKQFEGYAPRASWDYKQFTNGYGTRAQAPGEQIDQDEAERRLNSELGNAGGLVATHFPGIPQGPHAALTSLTFNAGPDWINQGLGDAVRSGDWDTAKRLFQQYNHAGGQVLPALSKRRAEEASWFDSEPGALSYASSGANAPSVQSSRQSGNQMPDPALSANNIAGGRGSLFSALTGVNANDSGDIRNSLQTAAAYAMALDNPAALGSIPNKTGQFSLVNGPDGSVYRLDNRTGSITRAAGPQGKVVKVGSGPLGDVQGIQRGNKIFDMSGNLLMDLDNPGATAAAGGTGGSATGSSSDPGLSSLLKPGVKYDDTLPGIDRIDQFKPEYKQAIIDYKNGERMPTGRGDKYTQWIKNQAGRLAAENGEVASDTTFAAKRTALNDLNKQTPGSAGGQAIAALTTLEHNILVKDAYDKLNNVQMPGALGWLPGSSTVAHSINTIGNSKANNAAALKEVEDTTTRSAEESSRYYSGAQAAQAEKDRIHNLYNTNPQPSESDAVLRSERNLLATRAEQAIGNLTSTLGADHPKVRDLKNRLEATLSAFDARMAQGRQKASLPPGVRSIQVVP